MAWSHEKAVFLAAAAVLALFSGATTTSASDVVDVAASCTNRTSSSTGRLQVKCRGFVTISDMAEICARAAGAHVVLIMKGGPTQNGTYFNKSLTSEAGGASPSCIADIRISTIPQLEAIEVNYLFPELLKLAIRHTGLRAIPEVTRFQPKLKALNLSHNGITDLHLSSASMQTMPFLEVLDLSFNDITHLPPNALSQLRSLKQLFLSNNRISSVAPNFLSSTLLSLQEIDLHGNQLRELLEGDLKISSSVHINLNLAGNPLESVPFNSFTIFLKMNLTIDSQSLTCDCNARYLRSVQGSINGLNPTCGRPAEFRTRPLSSVSPTKLICTSSVSFVESQVPARVNAMIGEEKTLSCTFDIVGTSAQNPVRGSDVEVMWFKDNKEVRGTSGSLPAASLTRRRKKRSALDSLDFFHLLQPSPTGSVFFGGPLPKLVHMTSVVADLDVKNRFTGRLSITSVKYSDQGTYFCKISLSGEYFDSKRRNLYVDEHANITALVGPSEVKERDNVTLTCTTKGHPRPSILWQFTSSESGESTAITLGTPESQAKYQIDDSQYFPHRRVSSLTVMSVDKDSKGVYTCVAMNSFASSSMSASLNVSVAPSTVKTSVSSQFPNMGEALIVQCSADGTLPLQFKWYSLSHQNQRQLIKHEEVASQPQIVSSGLRSILFYSSLVLEGNHKYMCEASNDVGSASAELQFEVVGKPDVVPGPRTLRPPVASVRPTSPASVSPAMRVTSQDGTPHGTRPVLHSATSSTSDNYKVPFFVAVGVALLIAVLLLMAITVPHLVKHRAEKQKQAKC